MEKVKRNGWKVAFLAVIALMCCHVIFGDADNWEPPGPPAPTMKSLEKIYDAVTCTSPSVSQRKGLCKLVNATSSTTTTMLTVPTGERFVLRKLRLYPGVENWQADGGSSLLIRGDIINGPTTSEQSNMLEFPDGCAVVQGPNSLTFYNGDVDTLHTHWVGYFYDVP